MPRWLRRLRAAFGMGLTWAVGWAFVGGIIEAVGDPHGRIMDMWIQGLAIPGFFAGAIFSGLLSIAERRRRFEELSLARFGLWVAVVGMLLGGLAVWAGAGPDHYPLWLRGGAIMGPVTMLGAVSASGTLALARRAETPEALPRGERPGGELES